jgi:CRISPR-associated protein Csx10
MKQYFKVTTLDPVIMTQSSATEGGLQTLDYITGSAILGTLAGKLYAQLSEQDSWSIFHSGEVQFSACYPVVNDELSLPVPASWHFAKGDDWQKEGLLQAAVISNHASEHFNRDEQTQYKQCRSGFINSQGQLAHVKQTMITKTALDGKQTAAKGQLFNYSAINAGQSFIGFIAGDSEQLKMIKPHLAGKHSIGRSRSSEFGRVNIELIELTQPQVKPASASELSIYCVSDIECVDQFGLPTFTPTLGELVGDDLEGGDTVAGSLDAGRSYIRTTTLSRFNQKRGGFDGEQALISKGSVLVFKDLSHAAAAIAQLSENGAGINKQQGQGWVLANPMWQQTPLLSLPIFDAYSLPKSAKENKTANAKVAKANSPLTQFIAARLQLNADVKDDSNVVNTMLEAMFNLYNNARQYNRVVIAHDAGPSSSQLRRVTEVYRYNHSNPLTEIFEGKHAICNTDNDTIGWGISWDDGHQLITFSDAFKQLISGKSNAQIEYFLEQVCRYEPCQLKSLNKYKNELLTVGGVA